MNGRLPLRSLLPIAWALALAAAGPASAAPSFVKMFESLRPIEGRPSVMIASGQVHHALVDGFEKVEVVGEGADAVVVVTIATSAIQFLDIDDRFAFEFDLPPLAGGQHEVVLRRREPNATVTTEEARGTFLVHPPITVELVADPSGPGRFRVHAAGTSSGARFTGPPSVADGKIRVPVSLGCHLECLTDPPIVVDWDIQSDPVELLAREYTLELYEDPVPAGRARIAWRDRMAVAPDPVRVRGGYFAIEVELAAPHTEQPRLVMPVSADSALFYFFSKDNWELMVKVLDGCAINGHMWVYAAASTDVGYKLQVIDLFGGRGTKEYVFPGGAPAPALTDAEAFVCPCPVCSGP